jgi:hypothetical protein
MQTADGCIAWHQCKNQLDPHKNGRADAGMNESSVELIRLRACLILWLGLCPESVHRVDGQSINQRRAGGGPIIHAHNTTN